MKRLFILLLLLLSFFTHAQTFIVLDTDTHEIVEDVNFVLYKDKKQVHAATCPNDKATQLPQDIPYDSISFSKADYYPTGVAEKHLEQVVLLAKKTIYLDEIVINSGNNRDMLIGEANKFVKRQRRPIKNELIDGIVLKNEYAAGIDVDKVIFHIGKIKYKTANLVTVNEVTEDIPVKGRQSIAIGDLLWASDTLYLKPGDNKRVEVIIDHGLKLTRDAAVFVTVQEIGYWNAAGNRIQPDTNEKTCLEYQISEKCNYYSKTIDLYTKELSPNLININLMINYDFAFAFHKKPHKSSLVTPAILLSGRKAGE